MNEQYTRAPHQSTSAGSSPSPNAALLIDFDNVTMAMRSNLGQELRNFLNSDIIRGKVSVQRAYADWRRYPQYIVPLSEASIDLIFAPAYGSSKKNATDIRLAIDALEIVFTRPEIGTYILLSGDSDFSSLVLKLKEYGKYVIGVGLQESSSDLLVQNCDEYYSYNSLSGLTSADELSTQSHDPWELVERSVHRMEERDDVMRSDRLKQVMLEMDAGFDEKDHGFTKFNRFLAEASSRGLIKLRKIGDGQYEVKPARPLPDSDEKEDGGEPSSGKRAEKAGSDRRSAPEKPRKPRPRKPSGSSGRREPSSGAASSGRVDASALRAGYDLLAEVVGELADGGEPVRDSEVKREMLKRDESFDETTLGFSKFSRFLSQAHDEEVVDVAKNDDGNYYLAPSGAGISAPAAEPAREPERPPARPEPETRDRQPTPDRGEEPAAGPSAETEPEAETRAPAETADEEAAPSERESSEERETSGRRRRRGLGRRRSGSRSGGGSAASGSDEEDGKKDAAAPGPVDEAGADGDRADGAGQEPAAGSDEDAEAGAAGGRSGRSRARGGLGRFRRGSRSGGAPGGSAGSGGDDEDAGGDEGGDRPAAGTPAADAQAASGRPDPDAGSTDEAGTSGAGSDAGEAPTAGGAGEDPVGHMVGNYPGVGRKTAEKLVEAFGDDLFEVIDRNPDRLTEVLPEHRAQAVVEARQAERERVGT